MTNPTPPPAADAIRRWDFDARKDVMWPCDDGEFVLHTDYATLRASRDAAVAMLERCERWLDGVRRETDRDRFEKRWNTLQDEAAELAHDARALLARRSDGA